MNILVVGSGAREHALLWKFRQSVGVTALFCAPGNAGTSAIATNLAVSSTDIDGLVAVARQHAIDLTVVGPEVPLMLGIVDRFNRERLAIFGPTKAAAEIETSKVFSKQFMLRHGIPTAAFQSFGSHEFDSAVAFVKTIAGRIVIKADGLAGGKGVVICNSPAEAETTLDGMMRRHDFGAAGDSVVIEEFLDGEEASVLVITDGKRFMTLIPSQDHKRIFDNDKGKNTGGMGAYAPVPMMSAELLEIIERTIIRPALNGMNAEGRRYSGCLYGGIIVTNNGPKVIEFNCRFGDPEAEVVLPLLDEDLATLLLQASNGELENRPARWKKQTAVTVIIASGGYPDSYETGKPIAGLESLGNNTDVMVFHAGTSLTAGQAVTAGGRVLAVTAVGAAGDLRGTIAKAYHAVGQISFDGAHFRRDIGSKGIVS